MTVNVDELGIGAPLVDRKNEVMRTMSDIEVRKARRTISSATSRNIKSGFVRGSVYFCAGLTLAVLLFMIGYILVKGIPFLNTDLFSWKYTSDNCSVVPAMVNTLLMTLLALLIACPLGIGECNLSC